MRLSAALVSLLTVWAAPAAAMTLQVPAGGAAIQLPGQQVLCGPQPEGWTVEANRRRVKPDAGLAPGVAVSVTLAPSLAECGGERVRPATLLTTAELPSIELGSVTLHVDAGRLELRGQRLEGTSVHWRSGPAGGSDVCLNVERDGAQEVCAVGLPRDLPADPRAIQLRWVPLGGSPEPEVWVHDSAGRFLGSERMDLPIGRVVVGQVFSPAQSVDVATGVGRIELDRPEAISSVQCEGAHCELSDRQILVDSVPADSTTVTVRVRLQPRVRLARREGVTDTVSETFDVVRCPLTVVSGQPVRATEEVQVLVRLGAACAKDLGQLRWTINGDAVEVARAKTLSDGAYALLRLGRTARDRVRIAALRREDGSVVSMATIETRPAPRVETSLELPGFGEIDFIPKNQAADLTVSAVEGSGQLVPLPVAGAYEVLQRNGRYAVRGVYTSGGFTSLRFAYRDTAVPAEFQDTNFALLTDPVQRPLREASLPAPIGAASLSDEPIVALYCRVDDGREKFIAPGTSPHIPFSARDSCRLVIRRDRIPPASGPQRLQLEVTVTATGGAQRPEARVSQRLVLRHAPHEDVIWIRGAQAQFDRIDIRLTHLIDESLYMSAGDAQLEVPSAQWSVVTEDANFKFYATAAIPTNLFRFSRDPRDLGTGPLALNFGVLSRLTWLDSTGREGIVGLEAGMMGMGLATDRDRHLALVMGLGVAIPLGNVNQPTQAAVNIHAWVAYSFGERVGRLVDETGAFEGTVRLNPWAFVFGPSITIGSVGVFL